MLDRWVNIFFSLALIFVFILFGNSQEHIQILIGIVLAIIIANLAFIVNWLTIDGAFAAAIMGSITFGLGGLPATLVVLGFFISGSILSKNPLPKKGFLEKKFRREGKQVWANGFWFVLWTMSWYLLGVEAFMVAAITAISTSTSDTWATEIGYREEERKTRLITTGKVVEPGTHGGISFFGTSAALIGAIFIAVLFWGTAEGFSFTSFVVIGIIGFLGCLVDSYIGARYQGRHLKIPLLSIDGSSEFYVGNNFVNWLATGIASIISLILILIIGI